MRTSVRIVEKGGGIEEPTLQALIDQGLSVREIAGNIDRSVAVTRRWLQRYGLRTHRALRRTVPSDQARVDGWCESHGEVVMVRRSDGGWKCRVCRVEAVSRRRQTVKQILVAEAGGACVLCGYDRCVTALEFHHVDPATKRFGLAAAGRTHALARLREEAAKCVLVCSNCHAEIESGVTTIEGLRTVALKVERAPDEPSLESPPPDAG